MQPPTPLILLIENDESDVFFFRRALSRLGYRGTVRIVTGVTDARAYLENKGPYTDREYYLRPDLIVSDMKLTGERGTEFLEWLRVQDTLRDIPVVMLSGSSLPEEKGRSHELGARAFYVKSGDIINLTGQVEELLRFLPHKKPED